MLESVFGSKRVWTALVGLVLLILQQAEVPGIEEVNPDLIVVLIGVVIGGFSLRDPGQLPPGTPDPE